MKGSTNPSALFQTNPLPVHVLDGNTVFQLCTTWQNQMKVLHVSPLDLIYEQWWKLLWIQTNKQTNMHTIMQIKKKKEKKDKDEDEDGDKDRDDEASQINK